MIVPVLLNKMKKQIMLVFVVPRFDFLITGLVRIRPNNKEMSLSHCHFLIPGLHPGLTYCALSGLCGIKSPERAQYVSIG